ncbi:permease [Hydrogenobacter sp. T-2]|uniref:permease n=1 Tax=Pampinifervens diazotrophicum TaxID=1632018 RepID=UPI002B2617A8|nr:permease [Hydrogenobacter sp. T-2]WPM32499.1 permease [Hydrogenobacter sp. T-2]
MRLLEKFFLSLYDYTLDILPFFLIAVLITSILQGFTKLSWLKVFLKNKRTAPIYTGFLGGLLPLCSCSMLPVANLINSMSRSYAPVLSFLIVAPVVSPVTLILTYGYFGLPMTALRLFGTLGFALFFAYMAELFFKKPSSLPLSFGGASQSGWKSFGTHFKDNLFGIGKYLLLGIVIASLIKTLIPPELIRPIAGSFLSYPLVSFTSIPIYVCSGEEVPIAKALRDIGFSSGVSLTFMLGGTGICMPTIIATLKFLPKGLVVAYVIFWVIFSIIMGVVYDIFLWKF